MCVTLITVKKQFSYVLDGDVLHVAISIQ